MRKALLSIAYLLIYSVTHAGGVNDNAKRAEEIRLKMWGNSGKEFKVTTIPDKWQKESAVIIAKDVLLTYHKEPIVANLKYSRSIHYRIKLMSSSAIEEYSEFSLPGSGSFGNYRFSYYAGFKVIKASGEEYIISLDDMVKEKAALNSYNLDIYKLAIPNLEEGDILDYYTTQERVISLASLKYHSFDPAIFELNETYPIIKQRIAFEVLRRCYINLKTLNGAPSFKLTKDDKGDRNRYELIDSDRERVDDIRWFYKYREVPTVKFKVVYASAGVAASLGQATFIGETGLLKSKVSTKELSSFLKFMFNRTSSYQLTQMKNIFKKKIPNIKDKNELARRAFYAMRYLQHVKGVEPKVLEGQGISFSSSGPAFFANLSAFYRYKKIRHEVLVGIPRNISSLNDLILENELTYIIKVTEGREPIYLSYFDVNSIYGELDTELQGTTVYKANAIFPPSSWSLKKTTLPVDSADVNKTISQLDYAISDIEAGEMTLTAKESIVGASQDYYQRYLSDFYVLKEEENKMHPFNEDFVGYSKKKKAKILAKRKDILKGRQKEFDKNMKLILEDATSLEIEEVSDFDVIQSGRFEDKPEFIYEYKAEIKGPIRKVGPNYILDIGQLIDEQIQLTEEESKRDYDINMPYARSFDYNISVTIPDGFEVQGLEKLNVNETNETGGFISKASIEGNKILLQSSKFYNSNFEPKENWKLMWDFLSVAKDFNDKQILLKRNN